VSTFEWWYNLLINTTLVLFWMLVVPSIFLLVAHVGFQRKHNLSVIECMNDLLDLYKKK
jgi:hypothetical protein